MGDHHDAAVGAHREFAEGCEGALHEYCAEGGPRGAHCETPAVGDHRVSCCVVRGPHRYAVGVHQAYYAKYDEGVHHEFQVGLRDSSAASLAVPRAYEEGDELGCCEGGFVVRDHREIVMVGEDPAVYEAEDHLVDRGELPGASLEHLEHSADVAEARVLLVGELDAQDPLHGDLDGLHYFVDLGEPQENAAGGHWEGKGIAVWLGDVDSGEPYSGGPDLREPQGGAVGDHWEGTGVAVRLGDVDSGEHDSGGPDLGEPRGDVAGDHWEETGEVVRSEDVEIADHAHVLLFPRPPVGEQPRLV